MTASKTDEHDFLGGPTESSDCINNNDDKNSHSSTSFMSLGARLEFRPPEEKVEFESDGHFNESSSFGTDFLKSCIKPATTASVRLQKVHDDEQAPSKDSMPILFHKPKATHVKYREATANCPSTWSNRTCFRRRSVRDSLRFSDHFSIRRPSSSVIFRGDFIYLYELRSSQVQIKVSDSSSITDLTLASGHMNTLPLTPTEGNRFAAATATRETIWSTKKSLTESTQKTVTEAMEEAEEAEEIESSEGSLTEFAQKEVVKVMKEAEEFRRRCNDSIIQPYHNSETPLRIEIRDISYDTDGYLSVLRVIYTVVVVILSMGTVSNIV